MKTEPFALLWTARILGLALSAFLSLFALDAFQTGQPLVRSLADYAVHLVPASIVLAVVVVSWRQPWIGGVAFVLLAAAYAVSVGFRPDWTLAISGPLLLIGLLFLWSWRARHRAAAA
jgi:hypothetical protein